MQNWYFGTSSNQRPQAWQERARNTVDHRFGALRIVPPPTPGVPPTNMPATPLLAVAAASDTSTIGFRSSNPCQQQYAPSPASSSPMEARFASAILQAGSRSAPDVLGFRRPAAPEPFRSTTFPTEFRSGGSQRPGGLVQELTEGARQKTSRTVNSAAAPPSIAIPNSTSSVSNHCSRPPRFQRRPTPHTVSPIQPRYVEPPPGFHNYTAHSQPSREQGGRHHLPSRHGSSVAGGIHASSSAFGASRDHVSTELCEAILAGAARLAQESSPTGGSVVDMACMGPNTTAPVQPVNSSTAMASGGPHPTPSGSWDHQIAEPSFRHPMYEARSTAPTTTARQRAYEYDWLPEQSQVPSSDRFPEQRRCGSSLVGWHRLPGHEAGSQNLGVNSGYNVRGSVQRPCRVCGKVYTPH